MAENPLQQILQRAVRGCEILQNAGNDYPTDKVRQIGDALHRFAEFVAGQLIQKQRQNNRHGKADQQPKRGNPQGIEEGRIDLRIRKQCPEMLEQIQFAVLIRGPRASPDAAFLIADGDNPILKGQLQARHRPVAEYQQRREHDDQHGIQLPVPSEILQTGICFFIEREELRERFDDENIEYIL